MSENPSPTGMRRKPRQARSQERVNRILDVAEALFASQGYTATTTNAIAIKPRRGLSDRLSGSIASAADSPAPP